MRPLDCGMIAQRIPWVTVTMAAVKAVRLVRLRSAQVHQWSGFAGWVICQARSKQNRQFAGNSKGFP